MDVNKTPDVRTVEGQSRVVPEMGKEGDVEIVLRRGSSAKSYRTGQENVTASINGHSGPQQIRLSNETHM